MTAGTPARVFGAGRSPSRQRRRTSRTAWIAVVLTALGITTFTASSATADPSAKTRPSVFRAASVSLHADVYTVTWRSGASRVTVVANNDPNSSVPGTTVGHGPAAGTVRVSGLAADRRWYFHLQSAKGSVVVAPASLGLADDPNLRDLGGYRTSDGQWVKEGLLFRGGAMNTLTDPELAALQQLGISADIDLRAPAEVSSAPDRVPAGAEYISDSILLPDDPEVLTIVPPLDLAETLREMGYSAGLYKSLYLEMGGLPTETYGYRKFFRYILAAHGKPVLFHCTAGDDRTGWASFVLLRLLGVSEHDALQNYLDSNTYNSALLSSYTAYFESIGFTAEQSNFFLKAAYIRAALQAMNTVYGSFDNYVHQGLNLTPADIATLRNTYLSS